MADLKGKNTGFLEPCESEDVKVSTVVTWLNVPVFCLKSGSSSIKIHNPFIFIDMLCHDARKSWSSMWAPYTYPTCPGPAGGMDGDL